MAPTTKLVNRIWIDASIQDVWDTLTKEGEALPFFFNSVLHTTKLAPGAPMRMRSVDEKYTGVVGEVLEIDPPYRYVTTFKFTNFDDPPCKVIHELKEVDGGVQYTLISEDIPAGTKTEKQMKQGGSFITKTLKGVVENGKAPLSSRLILAMVSLFAWTTPKQCLSENWPLDKKIE
ncbi:MAG: SRPBCC domain-containing protein [Pirellulales bacterium]|nr:SRPBCC domain-containing protein [Pirellulales bacterium]